MQVHIYDDKMTEVGTISVPDHWLIDGYGDTSRNVAQAQFLGQVNDLVESVVRALVERNSK